MAWLLALTIGVLPGEAAAYIDPGTTGMMSQALYVLFYGILGVFFYYLRHLKSWVARSKTYLAKLSGRQT
jgi:hypothetical protein